MPGSTTDAGPRAAGPEPDAQSPDAATKEPSSGKKGGKKGTKERMYSTAEGDHGFVALDVVPLVAARR